ncbi:hypothetical protein JCM8547_004358 [Rhodosporidiobolus lusitaniae]
MDYFRTSYGVQLRNPDWPCLQISRTGLWPLEICALDVGQKWGKKLAPAQVTAILRFTTINPQDRLPMLQRGIEHIFPSNSQAISQWGLQTRPTPIEVTARVLPPPSIAYSRPQPVRPTDGVWRGDNFAVPAQPIQRWAAFVLATRQAFPQGQAQNAIRSLTGQLEAMGIRTAPQPEIFYCEQNLHESKVEQFIRNAIGKT